MTLIAKAAIIVITVMEIKSSSSLECWEIDAGTVKRLLRTLRQYLARQRALGWPLDIQELQTVKNTYPRSRTILPTQSSSSVDVKRIMSTIYSRPPYITYKVFS